MFPGVCFHFPESHTIRAKRGPCKISSSTGGGHRKVGGGKGGWIVFAGGGRHLSGGIFHLCACGRAKREVGRKITAGAFPRSGHGGDEITGDRAAAIRVFWEKRCAAVADGDEESSGRGTAGACGLRGDCGCRYV